MRAWLVGQVADRALIRTGDALARLAPRVPWPALRLRLARAGEALVRRGLALLPPRP